MWARWTSSRRVIGYPSGKMVPPCLHRTTGCPLQVCSVLFPYNKSFIDQACSVNIAGYWPCSFFVCLWNLTLSQSTKMQKKNLANIEPYYMACVCSRYNTHSDWLIMGHYSPVMPMGRLWACKSKAKCHIINNLLTLNVQSLQENLKPPPCYIDRHHSVGLRFSHRDLTLG